MHVVRCTCMQGSDVVAVRCDVRDEPLPAASCIRAASSIVACCARGRVARSRHRVVCEARLRNLVLRCSGTCSVACCGRGPVPGDGWRCREVRQPSLIRYPLRSVVQARVWGLAVGAPPEGGVSGPAMSRAARNHEGVVIACGLALAVYCVRVPRDPETGISVKRSDLLTSSFRHAQKKSEHVGMQYETFERTSNADVDTNSPPKKKWGKGVDVADDLPTPYGFKKKRSVIRATYLPERRRDRSEF